MFTGIIKEVGTIDKIEKAKQGIKISIKCQKVLEGLNLGDSVSVDGVCLTASAISKNSFSVYASEETIKKTTLAKLRKGALVNLEPALKAQDPIGGHFVQGHIEGIGRVLSISKKGEEIHLKIKIPKELLKNVIEKGSIAVSGVSLTVSAIKSDVVDIFLIPFTLNSTNLKNLEKDSPVNIETDILCRTVVSFLEKREGLTIKDIIDEGY
ncbi:MAG: riboflavin synthase [Acidobacteriota bacterium]